MPWDCRTRSGLIEQRTRSHGIARVRHAALDVLERMSLREDPQRRRRAEVVDLDAVANPEARVRVLDEPGDELLELDDLDVGADVVDARGVVEDGEETPVVTSSRTVRAFQAGEVPVALGVAEVLVARPLIPDAVGGAG